MKHIEDDTLKFVKEIYTLHIPDKSELSNPFSANKRQKSKKIVIKDKGGFPEDINKWATKTFVEYFAEEYKTVFKAHYKITYTSDNKTINQIFDFMEDNNLSKNEWTKKFLDWCFTNKDILISKTGNFLLYNLPNLLNRFYQDLVINDHTSPTIKIFDIVDGLAKEGKAKEIYSKFGIPVASSYYKNIKNINDSDIFDGLKKLFESLSKGTAEDKILLQTIIQRSISRSPYPAEFSLLDWREHFELLVEKYKIESWWRDEDYQGKPRYDYDKFLNNG